MTTIQLENSNSSRIKMLPSAHSPPESAKLELEALKVQYAALRRENYNLRYELEECQDELSQVTVALKCSICDVVAFLAHPFWFAVVLSLELTYRNILRYQQDFIS